jgi:hypothetical protein
MGNNINFFSSNNQTIVLAKKSSIELEGIVSSSLVIIFLIVTFPDANSDSPMITI